MNTDVDGVFLLILWVHGFLFGYGFAMYSKMNSEYRKLRK